MQQYLSQIRFQYPVPVLDPINLAIGSSSTVEPHLSGPQLSSCSDYPTIELMFFFYCALNRAAYSLDLHCIVSHIRPFHISGLGSVPSGSDK